MMLARTRPLHLTGAFFYLSPAHFGLQRRWLSSLTLVTWLSTLPGMRRVAALLQTELFWRKGFVTHHGLRAINTARTGAG